MSTTKLQTIRSYSSNKKRNPKAAESFRIKTKPVDQSKDKVYNKLSSEFYSVDHANDSNSRQVPATNLNMPPNIIEKKIESLMNQVGKIPFKLDQTVVNKLKESLVNNEEIIGELVADPLFNGVLQVKPAPIQTNQDFLKKLASVNSYKPQASEENRTRERKENPLKKVSSMTDNEMTGGEEEIMKNNSSVAGIENRLYTKEDSTKPSPDLLPNLAHNQENRFSRSVSKKRHSQSESPSQERNRQDHSLTRSDRKQLSSTPKQDGPSRMPNKSEIFANQANTRFGPLAKITEVNAKKTASISSNTSSTKGPNKQYPITNSNSVFRSKAYVSNTVTEPKAEKHLPAVNSDAKNLLSNKSNVQPLQSYSLSMSHSPNPTTPRKPGFSQMIGSYRPTSEASENIFSSVNELAHSLNNKAGVNGLLNNNRKPQPMIQGKNIRGFTSNISQVPQANLAVNNSNAQLSTNPSQNLNQNQNQLVPQGQGQNPVIFNSPPKPMYLGIRYEEQVKKKVVYVPPPVSNKYKFVVGGGNNPQVVRRVLAKRDWWEETEMYNTLFNLKWMQTYRGYKYERLDKIGVKQLVNHFEYHAEISTKDNLIKNLSLYAEANKINLFEMTPLTFMFNMADTVNFDSDMQKFAKFFIKNHPDQAKYTQPNPTDRKNGSTWFNFDYRKKGNFHIANSNGDKADKKKNPYLKPFMPKTFLKNTNAWVLKPVGYNRGRGVEVFNDLETLNQLINECFYNAPPSNKKKAKKDDGVTSGGSDDEEEDVLKKELSVKSQSFVIQKYIEDVLLINKRKFDIRVWVLVTQDLQLYFFKEGYLRTSSEEFSLNGDQVLNKFIHLTNNAVQKFSNGYGQHESGNQLSFKDFEEYMKTHNMEGDFQGKILPRMKELVKMSMQSVGRILNQHDRKFCFELFGYDFMIDGEFNPWLIEVNTNPCIEESSPLLGMLMPRMLDDAFKMTVDVLFPRLKKPAQPKQAPSSDKKPENVAVQKVSLDADVVEQKDKEAVETNEGDNVEVKAEGQEGKEEATAEGNEEKSGHKKSEDDAKSGSDGGETVDTDKSSEKNNNAANVEAGESKLNNASAVFTSPKKTGKGDEGAPVKETVFPVVGYSDTESMWEFLGSLAGIAVQKSPNKRDARIR